MTISHWYHLNTYLSLAIIVVILAAAIILSMKRARLEKEQEAVGAPGTQPPRT
jgi:predicted tellurium resistance membrane protein TerC